MFQGVQVKPGWQEVKEAIQRANRYVAGAGAFSLVFLMLLTAADVLGRDLLGRPVPGAVELSQYLLAVFILLGLAYIQQVKGHVTVSILLSRFPVRGQFLLKLISSVLGLGLFVLVAWQGWVVGLEERAVSDLLRVPQSPFRILVAVAGGLVCLELLIDAGDAMRGLLRRSS
jgi:TRAP-type C4-dicarboxylate transport system permease small subunit